MLLRIAVDAKNLLHDRRGIGVYLRALLSRFIELNDVAITLVVPGIYPWRWHDTFVRQIGQTGFSISRGVPPDANIVWHPWNGTFLSNKRCPSVATIHDVAPFAFPSNDDRERSKQQEPFLRSASAQRIVTDSLFSRDEIIRHLGVAPEKIDVVPLAADPRFTPGEPTSLPDELRGRRYVLAVGADDERKNLATLVAAYRAEFAADDVALVCVTNGTFPGAITFKDVGFDVLQSLYRGALAFAMPSRYEGFGIPPLEAMGCGTPVVASRASSLPEVCKDAAFYVDAFDDISAWQEALRRIVNDEPLRRHLRDAGQQNAQMFSWNRTAEQTLEVFRRAATGL